MSKNSFQVNNSLLLTPNTEPANPQNGEIYYSSTENKFKKYENGAWTDLGSGGGVSSYITEGATGWVGYNDSPATTRPVDGTGGSTLITLTDKTSTPISGTSSLLFTKPASNVQGQGVSKDFTIDIADKANVLTIEFPYLVNSGTFAAGSNSTDGDLIVYIYDVTNARLIEPVNFKFFSNSSTVPDKFVGSFQTSSDSVNYRLILHVASTSASAFSLEMGQIQVSASNVVNGSPITDWQTYTPSWGAATTSPVLGNGTITGRWRQVGDTMQISVRLTMGSTTTYGTGAWFFTIPSGYSVDTTKNLKADTSINNRGGAFNGSSIFDVAPYYRTTTTIGVRALNSAATFTSHADINNNTPFAWASTHSLQFDFEAPIQGWSSNTRISDGYEGRDVVGAAYRIGSAQTGVNPNNSAVKIQLNGLGVSNLDTVSGWDLTTNYRYNIKTSGNYSIDAGIYVLGTNVLNNTYFLQVGVNNTTFYPLDVFNASTGVLFALKGNITIPLVAGDYVELYLFGSGNNSSSALTVSSGNATRLIVSKAQSGQTIAALPIVALHASGIAGADTIGTSLSLMKFTTKDSDTHNAYSTSTGLFTAPESGFYNVAWRVLTATVSLSTSERFFTFLYKDGVSYRAGSKEAGTGTSVNRVSVGAVNAVYLTAGQTLSVYAVSSVATTAATGVNDSHFTVTKVG